MDPAEVEREFDAVTRHAQRVAEARRALEAQRAAEAAAACRTDAAGEGAVELPGPPASRTARLLARAIDQLLLALPLGAAVLGALAVVGLGGVGQRLIELEVVRDVLAVATGAVALALFPIGAGLATLITCYQWHSIATRGASLGKRLLGLRIVREDGAPLGFVRGVAMREWLFGALAVPFLGQAAYVVDLVPIFRDERRCAHDYLAGTHVISTRSRRGVAAVAGLVVAGCVGAGLAWVFPDLARLGSATEEAASAGGEAPGDALSRWRTDLGHSEPKSRWTAVQQLGHLGANGRAAEVVPLLVEALADEHFVVRLDAIEALAGLGAAASPATAELQRLEREDPSPVVRRAARDALTRVSGGAG